MADTNENVEVSESQIAAHWKEEELIYPSPGFVAEANMADPDVFERFSEQNFPECFREYADLLTWDKNWHTTLDTSTPPFLELVPWRATERELQLRGQAPGQVQEQGGLYLGSGA